MKFSINTSNLQKALTKLGSIPGSRDKDPLQSLVKIEADAFGTIIFSRTTASAQISCELETTDIDADGVTFVGYAMISAACGKLARENVSFELKGESMIIKSGTLTAKIPVFVALMQVTEHATGDILRTVELVSDSFLPRLKCCLGSTEDLQNSAFSGVNFRTIKGNRFAMFATDRKKMAFYEFDVECEPIRIADGFDIGVSIPTETGTSLIAIMADSVSIKLDLGESNIAVTCGTTKAILPVLNLGSLDVEKFFGVLQAGDVSVIDVDKQELISAILAVQPICNRDLPQIELFCSPIDDSLKITARDGANEMKIEVPAICKGELKWIFFSPKLFLPFLRFNINERAVLRFNQERRTMLEIQDGQFHTAQALVPQDHASAPKPK